MKKLGTCNIFGEKWPIYTSPKVSDELCGYCDFEKMRIVINDKLPDERLFLDTLFHEILHGLFNRMSYKQSGIPHELEEVMIDQISKCLTENLNSMAMILEKYKALKKQEAKK